MFDDRILEEIFGDPDLRDIPLVYISMIVHTVEQVLDKHEKEESDVEVEVEETT